MLKSCFHDFVQVYNINAYFCVSFEAEQHLSFFTVILCYQSVDYTYSLNTLF